MQPSQAEQHIGHVIGMLCPIQRLAFRAYAMEEAAFGLVPAALGQESEAMPGRLERARHGAQ